MSNSGHFLADPPNPQLALRNLLSMKERMDTLQRFLNTSFSSNTPISQSQMDMVSSELVSAIHQTVLSGSALLSCYPIPSSGNPPPPPSDPKVNEPAAVDANGDSEIIELDAVEILAEHVHFCDVCGKGFKRDANLRMHMRAHGDRFKTHAALAKPAAEEEKLLLTRSTRFSCPFKGCNRNKESKKFKALKSVICLRNHFKRTHCPKTYSCSRCNKKNFSVLADLKSHLKHCGEDARWRCSCGTSFSRKDKLFGHVALFEGHMPAVGEEEEEEQEVRDGNEMGLENEFFDELGLLEGYCFEDMMGSSSGWDSFL